MLELPGYKIEKQIGKGGMARVYLAVHEGLHREVAIKVMSKHLDEDAGFGERFMREARIVANLNHQHIVTVFDVNNYDGYHYIAMEYLPGGITLDHKIKEGITPAEGITTIQHVAAALGYAHSKGIIHRDVKPENIMYREDGSAVLTDFGIARSTTSVTKMTATGTVIGTPHYMSPEQAQGEELGPGADIYSLGVVLYETLTGEVPFDADSSIAIVFKHITEPVPQLEGELAAFQPVVDRMMAKDKESRYQDCNDIIADLDNLMSGGGVSKETLVNNATAINPATPEAVAAIRKATGQTTAPAAPPKKKRLVPALAAIVLVIASAAGYVFYTQDQAEKEQQRLAQLEQQRQQKQLEDKQLAAKLAAEKAAREKAEKLKAAQLAEQNQAAQQEQAASRESAQEKAAAEEAERLAALERSKAEAALQEKREAEREQARRAVQQKITQLLASAESNLQKTRLRGAYRDYQEILKLEPGHDKAEDGVTRVADRYLALARNSAQSSDFERADGFLGSAAQIAPTHDKLAATRQEIAALKDAEQAKQEAERRAYEKKLTDLFANAESQLLNTRLEAAYQSFQQILALEPGNDRAKNGITRVADRYLALARSSALASDFDQANSHLSAAIKIAPTHDKLGSTQQEIFDLRDAQLLKEAEAQRAQQEPATSESAPEPDEPVKKRRTFGAF